MRVAVIGAGPAGITAAYQLAKRGTHVEVFEAGGAVGGLSRSLDLWGQKVDLGPHRFFSQDPRVNKLWLEVVGRDYRMVNRLTRIYYQHRFFDYPLRPANALWNMGLTSAARCVSSYLKEKVRPSFDADRNETFESWVVGRFGRRLFDMFFKSYSEKLWGIPCDALDADFAAQRIKKFSLGQAVKAALGIGTAGHKTLVEQFAYPVGGTGMVYERMANRVMELGGRLHLNCPVKKVVHHLREVQGIELADGQFQAFDRVISTMPLTLLVRGLGQVPAAVEKGVSALRFRNTILVYLRIAGQNLFKDQWLYIHSPELGMGRVTNFRNWVPELCGTSQDSILALEYWCDDDDATWRESDSALVERGEREIRATGMIGAAPLLEGHVSRIRRCYPVYARGYKKNLEPVVAHLRRLQGLSVIGRYGSFKYNNQDHSILMGLLAAENILDNKQHDLWAVNTDATYQESAIITDTGLEYEDQRAAKPKPTKPRPVPVRV